jgi:hypothetical protein
MAGTGNPIAPRNDVFSTNLQSLHSGCSLRRKYVSYSLVFLMSVNSLPYISSRACQGFGSSLQVRPKTSRQELLNIPIGKPKVGPYLHTCLLIVFLFNMRTSVSHFLVPFVCLFFLFFNYHGSSSHRSTHKFAERWISLTHG